MACTGQSSLGTFINSFILLTRIAAFMGLHLSLSFSLCKISFLGDGTSSDMLCHMLKPSNDGEVEFAECVERR